MRRILLFELFLYGCLIFYHILSMLCFVLLTLKPRGDCNVIGIS